MEINSNLLSKGVYHAECWSLFNEDGTLHRDENGNPCRRLKWVEDPQNKITNEGLNYLNNVTLYTTTKLSSAWYLALINTNTTADAAMTYATPVYTESTDYSGNRKACTFGASSSQAITNSGNVAVFTMTGTPGTMYGASLVGANAAGVLTPGDAAASGGVLFSYAKFGTARAVVATDVINLTYTNTSASST